MPEAQQTLELLELQDATGLLEAPDFVEKLELRVAMDPLGVLVQLV